MPIFHVTAVDTTRAGSPVQTLDESFGSADEGRRALAARGLSVLAIEETAGAPTQTAMPAPGPQVDQSDLIAFFGPNADYYLEAARRIDAKGFAVNGAAFLFGPFWAFYRKLPLEGLALLAVPMVIVFTVPELGAASAAVSIACGVLANRYYISHARAKVAAARFRRPEDRKAMIAGSGGTSRAASLFAIALAIAIFGGGGYLGLTAFRLPQCGAPETAGVLERIAQQNWGADTLRIARAVELGSGSDWRECRATVVTSIERTVTYRVMRGSRSGEFWVRLH